MLGMVKPTCNPDTWEAEARGLQVWDSLDNFEKPCFKTKEFKMRLGIVAQCLALGSGFHYSIGPQTKQNKKPRLQILVEVPEKT